VTPGFGIKYLPFSFGKVGGLELQLKSLGTKTCLEFRACSHVISFPV
jgi:hypothetical protein